MSYYTPETGSDDRYYSPESNTVQQQDVGAGLQKGIGMMAAAIGLNVAGVALTKMGISSAKNLIRSWEKNPNSIIRKGVANEIISAHHKFKQKVIDPYRESLTKSPIYTALKQRDAHLNRLKDSGAPNYNLERIRSAFKNPLTFAGTAARIWKKNVLQGVGVAYGVDSMLGITREMGLEKKDWYDIPGQVENFAKWGAISSIGGMLLGGIGPAARATGTLGMMGVSKVFRGELGQSALRHMADRFGRVEVNPALMKTREYFRARDGRTDLETPSLNMLSQHELNFMSDVNAKRLHLGKNVSEAWSTLGQGFNAALNSITQAQKNQPLASRIKKAYDVTKAAVENSGRILKQKTTTDRSSNVYGGLHVLKELHKFSQEVKEEKIFGKVSLWNSADEAKKFNSFFQDHIKGQRKESTLQKLFGPVLKTPKVKDVVSESFINNIKGNLSRKYETSQVDQLLKHIGNLNVGTNIYRNPGIKGGMVDLNFLDPVGMMRRAIAPILEHRLRVPFVGIDMSIAELTGTSQWISDKPKLYATREKPNLQFIDKTAGKYNLADIVDPESENNFFIFTEGGRWAAFDNGVVKYANTGRNIYYSPKSGFDKSYEIKNINYNKFRALNEGKTAAEVNRRLDAARSEEGVDNPFFGFLRRKGIDFRKSAENLTGFFKGKFTQSDKYRLHLSNFFDGDPTHAVAGEALLENIYGGTNRVLSRVASNKKAMQAMADFVGSTQIEGRQNFFEAISDQQSLINEVVSLQARGKMGDGDLVTKVRDMQAFPKEARKHYTSKPLGNLSAMTDFDELRVSYIQNVFHEISKEPSSKALPHPMLSVADELHRQGIITSTEKKGLKLNAQLHSLVREDGLFKNNKGGLPKILEVSEKIRKRSRQEHQILLNDLVDFASNTRTPRPQYRYDQERILHKLDPNSEFFVTKSNIPFVSIPTSPLEAFKEIATKAIERGTDVVGEYTPFTKDYFKHHGLLGNTRYLGKMALTVAGVAATYKLADFAFAANPMFDDTILESGLTGAGADLLATTRLGIARVSDLTGITATMKHIHGLTPGLESTLPGAFAGAALSVFAKASPASTAFATFGLGLANRILSPYLPDLTKSHEELVEIYSGRKQVPIMKSPTWLLGGTPWEGTNVIGYTPNWYVQAKSRWKETDTLYGSAFRKLIHEPLPILGFNVGDILDPYYMERKNYFTRPYGITGGVFNEVPIIGGILSNTIGRVIKPQKTMHQEFLKAGMNFGGEPGDPYPFAIAPPTIPENLNMMNPGGGPANTMAGKSVNYGRVSLMNSKYWAESAAEDFLYDVQSFTGLKGFLAGTITERLFNMNKVVPTLETAGRMASFSRSYYDMNLGGMGVLTEGVRRMVEKPEYRQYGLNPIPNRMPEWLGQKFLTGDPYVKIMKGELRLPGSAYLATHTDVDRSMPARASMIGGNIENIVQYFTGLISPNTLDQFEILEEGTSMHAAIQKSLATEGMLIQAEAMVQDVKNDITGHVDAIIRDGEGAGGRRALEIKTISEEGLAKLDAPKSEHFSQLNFYLRQLKMKKGTLLYVSRDNPANVKSFEITYSKNRFMKDLAKLNKARTVAKVMMEEGVGDSLGYSYSWPDRLRILADVAPNSKEFKEAREIVEAQIRFGVIGEEEMAKYESALKMKQARIRSYELYPTRFKGKILHPDKAANIQSINEDIKAGAEYTIGERAVGALWENFTNNNNFIVNKFFNFKDPIEHYKMTRLYGKEYKPWDEPIRGWVDPYMRSLLSKTNAQEGATAFGTIGYVFGGGPIGAAVGGILGAAYGAGHGIYRAVTGSTYIPGSVQEKREIVSYFDAAKYERNSMLASLSTGLTQQEFLAQKNATLRAFNEGGPGATVANMFRATSTFEKPYIEAWLNTTDPEERKNILKFIPDDLAMALKRQWGSIDSKDATRNYLDNSSAELTRSGTKYAFDRSILDPRVPLEDIQLKTIQERGLDSFEFGLGWNEQMLRIQESNQAIKAAQIERFEGRPEPLGGGMSSANVKGIINNYFSKNGVRSSAQVYVDQTINYNQVNIIIRRDRANTIISALDRRKKYGLSNE